MSNVVIGVTGSIAAYKACLLVRACKKRNMDVKVILTKNACEFITPLTMETLSDNAVACDMFHEHERRDVEHISLAKWADVFVIAPASANFIGKYRAGIADDMLTTTVLATKAPVVIAPAMNTAMYDHPAMQENMSVLKERGVHFIEPDSGFLACGDTGRGRMEKPDIICDYICSLCSKKDMQGKRFVITAGATIEDIDPVRFITNRSTGKMGVSIANAAFCRGGDVTLIAGSMQVKPISGVKVINVRSTHDMYTAVRENIENADVYISAAAPCDFTPETKSDKKIKKTGQGNLDIHLVPTVDILKSIADNKGSRIHIGFAAETNDVESNAKKKLDSKNLDAIAANDVAKEGCGFGTDTNCITLYKKDGTCDTSGMMTKIQAADWLLDRIKDFK